uniref:Uncharacterized protein n=1 Tax=Rhizophora mucronata TaxID=61149 RepID=A0A2P2MZQ2_RHIMU
MIEVPLQQMRFFKATPRKLPRNQNAYVRCGPVKEKPFMYKGAIKIKEKKIPLDAAYSI